MKLPSVGSVIKVSALVLGVVVVGGSVYEAISNYLARRNTDTLIAAMRSDNRNIIKRLVTAQTAVANLQTTVGDLGRTSSDLAVKLANSQRIVGELQAENNRLTGAIGGSIQAAGDIATTSSHLGDAIAGAWEIVERYKIPD